MVIGTSVLSTKAGQEGMQKVWYGDRDWYVIAADETETASTATLLQVEVKETSQFNAVYNQTYSNAYGWMDSDLDEPGTPSTLRFFIESHYVYGYTEGDSSVAPYISRQEQRAIVPRTLEGGSGNYGTGEYDNNKIKGKEVKDALVWPLSVAEAEVLPDSVRATGDWWWLRSPGTYGYLAAVVGITGYVYYIGSDVNDLASARPAFYLNLESVIFTSAAEGGKSSGTVGADALTLIGTNSTNEWKVTLKDSGRNFSATATSGIQDNSVEIKYSSKNSEDGAIFGANEYISAVIENSNGDITYYGRLKNVTTEDASEGTLTVKLPEGLAEGDTLFLFSEQYNGDKTEDSGAKTDYASELVEITPLKNSTVTVSAEDAKCGQDATINVTIPSDATGKVTVTVTDPQNKATAYDVTIAEADGGKGSVTLPSPAVGEYSVTAAYEGGGNYLPGSTASAVKFKVTHDMQEVPGAQETCTEDGNKPYNICNGCGKWFIDSEGENEITDHNEVVIPKKGHTPAEAVKENETAATVEKEGSYDEVVYCSVCKEEISRKTVKIDKISYKFSKGDGSKWTKGSIDTLDFTVNRSADDDTTFDRCQKIVVDGKTELTDADCTKSKGSLNVSIKASFLEKLSEGKHTLVVTFDDGDSPEMTFTIEAKQEETKPDTSPKTGDNGNAGHWAAIMGGALLAVFLLIFAGKKYLKKQR